MPKDNVAKEGGGDASGGEKRRSIGESPILKREVHRGQGETNAGGKKALKLLAGRRFLGTPLKKKELYEPKGKGTSPHSSRKKARALGESVHEE